MEIVEFFSLEKMKRKQPETTGEFFAPLAGMTYEEQLEIKDKTTRNFQVEVTKELKKRCLARKYPVPVFSPKIEKIVSLPQSLEISHRNKCEFTFGPDGGLGFVKRSGTNFHVEAITAENPLVPPEMLKIVNSLKSTLLPLFTCYSRGDHSSGLLRTATVRLGAGACLMIQVKQWPGGEEEVARLRSVLLEIVKNDDLNIVSLWLQLNPGLSDACNVKPEFLWGAEEGVTLSVCDLKFQVNPLSFFQTNTRACEMLYSLVADWASETSGELLLDLCCGVGTIGQVLAKKCSERVRVVGVELIEEAVVDARRNAQRNFGADAERLRFESGRVEDVLPSLLKEELDKNSNCSVVAIVDPPRSGLHSAVLRALRDNPEIKTVIYVSCNPETLARDTELLIEPLTDCPEEEGLAVSKPFRAERVVAVDMFPNTAHCEMVLRLVR